ncbi:unnamed protein product [Lymnaea stagnalis]|uniref:Uncharacterized protein n=1 Tax=Lymnaea stagnalis TaxID=6523 RepID=A0AAV2IQ61_LYMST
MALMRRGSVAEARTVLILQWLLVLLMLLVMCAEVQSYPHLFYPDANQPWNNYATGKLMYNGTGYTPTCGWKVILSSSYPMCDIKMYDSTWVKLDEYKFLISSTNLWPNPVGHTSSMELNGRFGSTWPSVIANWYCVCNASTSGYCESAPYETVSPTNATPSAVLCPATTAGPTTPAATTVTTTTTTTTAATTIPRTPSSMPSLTVEDVYSSASSYEALQTNVKKFESLCYVGSRYTTIAWIYHLVDCCTLCCTYTTCEGVNFREASNECDLIFENLHQDSSSSMGTVAECTFWKVTYRS